jgi:hypothetical protein
MKNTCLPEYAIITQSVIIMAGLAIAGCEHSEPKQQPQTPQIAVVESAPVKNAEARKPLDLSLEKIADEYIDTHAFDVEPNHSLIYPARKNVARFEFSGNLLTDASVEDYVDSIKGATLNITIKTR